MLIFKIFKTPYVIQNTVFACIQNYEINQPKWYRTLKFKNYNTITGPGYFNETSTITINDYAQSQFFVNR